MIQFRRTIAGALMVFATAVPTALANIPENMGYGEFDDPLPALRDKVPIADQETQRMAIDIEHTSCEDLQALSPELKQAFLAAHLYLQRPGSLSKVIDPECGYLGNVEMIALISDPALTLGDENETLYYLTDADALIVSHKKRDAIAYGMYYDGEGPIDYFLENRTSAEQSATLARVFLETVATIEPSPKLFRETSSRLVFPTSSAESQAVQTSSSVAPTEQQRSTATTAPEANQPNTTPPVPTETEPGTDQVPGTQVAPDSASGAKLPDIEPLGPEPQPPQSDSTPWVAIVSSIVFVLIAIILFIAYRKARSATADQLPDDSPTT